MDLSRHRLILAMVEGLRRHDSWTGKTHLQKGFFLLEALSTRSNPFIFVLYKHGPYSFELEDDLGQMMGYGGIVSDPTPPYGVTLRPGKAASFVKNSARLSPARKRLIGRVCRFIGDRNVTELERIATAAWIRKREKIRSNGQVATRLHQLKPHISIADAERADEQLAILLASS